MGETIEEVEITQSGLLAAMHLVGPGGTIEWIQSGGNKCVQDAYKTSINEYLQLFSGYNVKQLTGKKMQKIKLV